MRELKPCPFCGGEAHAERSLVVGICAVVCNCASHVFYDAEADMDKTIDAWNTRAERTCRVVKNSRKYVLSDGTELFDDGCSICNGYIGAGENYCSQCGARVVE